MLKSIDVLIGLIVVLLALSMAVTVITQAITALINSRGRHLRRGLSDLLQQLDPALKADISASVATALLTHPLVSGSSMPFEWGNRSWWRRLLGGTRLGNVVQREEFTKLLMALATGGAASSGLADDTRKALKDALARNGVADPEATLKDIRSVAVQLERASPAMSSAARQTVAILQAAESDLVGKINSWFDQTMDRTAQRFTASTRAITFAGAFIVAFGLQVDTVALVNRLAADDVLRAKLVRDAMNLPEVEPAASPASPPAAPEAETAPAPGDPPAPAAGAAPAADASSPTVMDDQYRRFLSEAGIVNLPNWKSWRDWKASFDGRNVFGVLMTALLLSLGAPFWYGVLRNLLQLRSVLAGKDDEQRNERQKSDSPPAAGPASGTAAPLTMGERGDLSAVG